LRGPVCSLKQKKKEMMEITIWKMHERKDYDRNSCCAPKCVVFPSME